MMDGRTTLHMFIDCFLARVVSFQGRKKALCKGITCYLPKVVPSRDMILVPVSSGISLLLWNIFNMEKAPISSVRFHCLLNPTFSSLNLPHTSVIPLPGMSIQVKLLVSDGQVSSFALAIGVLC